MGGVAPNFVEWANSLGTSNGRDWAKPNGKYAVAQLNPWVLWPSDELNFEQDTRGEWFGHGYLPCRSLSKKTKTDGQDIPTRNHC